MSLLFGHAACLLSTSEDLHFLRSVRNKIGRTIEERMSTYKIGNPESCNVARTGIRNGAGKVVVVFCHGTDDYIRSGEYQIRSTGETVAGEKFVTRNGAELFQGHALFCLSCDSNGLADLFLEKGVVGFVGFDAVPFNRFDSDGNPIGNRAIVKHSTELLAEAVSETLLRFFSGGLTLDQAVVFFRHWVCRSAVNFVRSEKGEVDRGNIAALLLRTKDGIRYHGQPGIRFDANTDTRDLKA